MTESKRHVVNAIGQRVPCHPYRRIVSLVPSITETLFDFGVEDRVVGVTRYCIHPPEAQQPPRVVVGGSKSPKIPLIKELKPDLVIINKEEQTARHARELQAFTTTFVTYPRKVTEAITMLEQLACLLMIEDDPRVKAIIAETNTVLASIQRITDGMDLAEKPRVFCPIWKNPWMTINSDTFIHDMITMAGGINVFEDKKDRYPTVTAKEIIAKRPDVILLPDEPYHFTDEDSTELRELFIKEGTNIPTIHLISGSYVSWYGSRTRKGLKALYEILNGSTTQ